MLVAESVVGQRAYVHIRINKEMTYLQPAARGDSAGFPSESMGVWLERALGHDPCSNG